MDMEVRLFVFNDDGTVAFLDKQRFDLAVEHQEPLTEFSGRCIKLAGVVMETGSGAVSLQDVYGQFVYFDQEGFVDETKLIESIRYSDKAGEEGYQNEFVWTPNEADRARIKNAIG
jgi:hypothetical protein